MSTTESRDRMSCTGDALWPTRCGSSGGAKLRLAAGVAQLGMPLRMGWARRHLAARHSASASLCLQTSSDSRRAGGRTLARALLEGPPVCNTSEQRRRESQKIGAGAICAVGIRFLTGPLPHPIPIFWQAGFGICPGRQACAALRSALRRQVNPKTPELTGCPPTAVPHVGAQIP